MTQFLAIVAYRCFVAGLPTDSIDMQVRWFQASDRDAVGELLVAEPEQSYQNADGETVAWKLAQVFSIDEFGTPESGDEVTGFIASADELAALAS